MMSYVTSHMAVGHEEAIASDPSLTPSAIFPGHYKVLDVSFEESAGVYWFFTKPDAHGSYTPHLLEDLLTLQNDVRRVFQQRRSEGLAPIRYVVGGSRIPGIFNLGGDLRLLTRCIRAQDRDSLQRYARACIDVLYDSFIDFELPLITVALIQGDTLGGGFESALSCDLIVAERGAKFGLPEVLFNLFPGMGAYSFLSRRLDAVRAERLILSGKLYDAEELHAMGIVDVLAEDGQGEDAVREYVNRNRRRYNAEVATYQTRRRVAPLDYQELFDVTEIWVEAALRLGESDLRKMERLVAAQEKRSSTRGLSK